MRHAMYDYAWMKCPSIHFFIWICFIPFSSFLVFSKIQNANVMPQLCRWNTMIGLTNVICKHCALTCYWQTLNHRPRCQIFMNANEMWCKSRFFISDANTFCRDVMMQMSLYGYAMMRMPLVGMSWCKCPLGCMQWCKCPCRYVMMRMSACVYAMMQMLWRKHNLFKNSLCFQNQGFLSAWNQKYFQILICYFSKSHLLIDLRLLKKLVITVRNLWMGHLTQNLMIWLKRFIFTIWFSKGVACFQGLFLEKKNKFFENQAS